jgi:hypothetical protein
MREFFESRKLTGTVILALDAARTWTADKLTVVKQILSIVTDYQGRGYRLTLRQLYYQLVAADAIPNHDKVYKKIGTILDDCRYSGKLDWDAIEDRGRVPKLPYFVDGVEDAVKDILSQYRLDRQIGQPRHIELWTEKDAISNILYQVTYKFHVRLVINKGYTSSSAMYQAYERFVESIVKGQPITILYFGDHDPSGLDMVRDIKDRLLQFFACGSRLLDDDQFKKTFNDWWSDKEHTIWDLTEDGYMNPKAADRLMNAEDPGYEDIAAFDAGKMKKYFADHEMFKVKSIGLTMDQIKQYKLPHNPAKITDPRAAEYVKKHGQKSWEVDALKPDVLTALVEQAIKAELDVNAYNAMIKKEIKEKKELEKFVKK